MLTTVSCDHCFGEFSVSSKLAGKKIRCKLCQEPVKVPSSSHSSRAEDELLTLPAKTARRSKKTAPRKSKQRSSSGSSTNYLRLLFIAIAMLVGIPVALVLLIPPIANFMVPNEIDWTEVSIKQGKMTAQLPNTPNVTNKTNANGVHIESYDSNTRKMGCEICCITFQPEPGRLLKIKPGDLSLAKQYLAVDASIQLEREELFDLQGIQAVRYIGKIIPTELEWRQETIMFLVGDSLYSASTREPYHLPQKSVRQKFFDSILVSDNLKQEYQNTQGSSP